MLCHDPWKVTTHISVRNSCDWRKHVDRLHQYLWAFFLLFSSTLQSWNSWNPIIVSWIHFAVPACVLQSFECNLPNSRLHSTINTVLHPSFSSSRSCPEKLFTSKLGHCCMHFTYPFLHSYSPWKWYVQGNKDRSNCIICQKCNSKVNIDNG